MELVQGDLKPDLAINLSTESRVVDLTTAETVTVVGMRGGTEVFRRPASSVSSTGAVTLQWLLADTATAGIIEVEVEVEWIGGIETFTDAARVEILAAEGRESALVAVQDLIDHMSGITLTDGQRRAARRIIDGVQRGLERALLRGFTELEVTERAYAAEDGWAMLTRTPVVALVSVDGSEVVDGYTVTRNGISGLYGDSWATVVYRGGGWPAPDDLDDIRLAILEKASDYMTNRHDDTQSVKELDTREPTVRPAIFRWSDAELRETGLDRLRRRVVI